MTEFRVAGVTKENDAGQDIQALLKRIIRGYKNNEYIESWDGLTKKEYIEYGNEGSEFEGQTIRNIIRLEREPDNKFDPNAIKVFVKDVNDGEHHIGYIKKENTEEVISLTHDKDVVGIAAEFTGGKHRYIEYDDIADDDYIKEKIITIGLKLIFIFKKEQTVAPVVKTKPVVHTEPIVDKEQGATLQKVGTGMMQSGIGMIGCGCALMILIPIIIVIIFWLA